ncbi:MAG TPA: carboxypeptidase-like regulatory domain-containing protein [Pirellulales bacterium]|nr:carboxypeptidase-like regulatory domain-containing protein [Pirellulales bacterium]
MLAVVALTAALHVPVLGDETAGESKSADPKGAESQSSVPMLTKRFRITNPQGDPVAGATVIPWAVRSERGHGHWNINGDYNAKPPTLVTDAAGRGQFEFPRFLDKDGRVPPQQYTCSVVHPNYAGSTYNDIPVEGESYKDESVIQVRQGALIEITLAAEGQSISLDDVYILWSSDAPDKYKNKINDRGAIVLPRLPAGKELLMAVYAPDDGPVLFSDVQKVELDDGDHHQLRMELKPGVRVEGRLTGSVERPVRQGRAIGVVIISNKEVEGNVQWRVAAKMRIDGSFVFESMPRGALQVIALCDGAVAESGDPPDFARDREKEQAAAFSRPQVFALWEEQTRIFVKMAPSASCRVQVLDAAGAPIKGAECWFSPNVGWWHGGSQIYGGPFFSTIEYLKDQDIVRKYNHQDELFMARTDEQGEALVANLPGGQCWMSVVHDEYRMPGPDRNRSQRVSLTSGQTAEVTVRMEAKK